MEEILGCCILLDSSKIFSQICISVREAVAEEDMVIIVLEGMSKSESEVGADEPIIVSSVLVSEVIDILTDSVPSYTFSVFKFIAKAKDFHAVVVKTIRFCQIKHVELDFLTSSSVTDPEEVPLRMSICVDVIL